MGFKPIPPKDGYEFRGVRIRLYPDQEIDAKLAEMRESLRLAWNWLVAQQETAINASRAYVTREGLVEPRPVRPVYEGMEPEDAKKAAEGYRKIALKWAIDAAKAAKAALGKDAYSYTIRDWCAHLELKYDYHLLNRVLAWHERAPLHAYLLQALAHSFLTRIEGQRRKTRKRREDHVPIRTRSGECFEFGSFGARGKNPAFYDCQIKVAGLKIRGRAKGMGIDPAWRVLEGVALTREADGWWAAIRVERPLRKVKPPTPGTVVGLDVGLRTMVAFSSGERITNPRGRSYADRIAQMQRDGVAPNKIARLQQKFNRNVEHTIYSKIIPRLEAVETIAIEELPPNIGQRGSRMTSVMRKVRSIVVGRFGEDRVQEVPAAYTSQECSQCGERDKEAWSYGENPICECLHCGHREDRDVNAARNIAKRAVK